MPTFKQIDAHTAKSMIDNKEAIIIDVRELAEYQEVHIPGATLIPLGTLQPEHIIPFSEKKIIIHCKLGKRGSIACEKLMMANSELQLFNIEGGITAWELAGLPVKRA